MSSTWGKNINLSIFGESHGPEIGVVISGLPAGIPLDTEEIRHHLARRAPGQSALSTPRKEADEPIFKSGILNGVTTGAPLCICFQNTDTKSQHYNEMASLMRPGHSDYPAHIRYHGYNDIRGGGHFSGRLTAPMVAAGSICRQFLRRCGIDIYAHISSVADISDIAFNAVSPDKNILTALSQKSFAVLDNAQGEKMQNAILNAKQNQNSVGGTIECMALGVPAGLGSPMFRNAESVIASFFYAIPAVKGVSFGSGFDVARLTGEENNDTYYADGGVKTRTNHSGGILGGITNGMPIVVHTAFKPTPTIGKEQPTVDIHTMQEGVLAGKGRHDPCIVPRAVVVTESALAICLMDLWLDQVPPQNR